MTTQPSTPADGPTGRRRKRHQARVRQGGTCGPPPADTTPTWTCPFTESPQGSGLFAATMLEDPPGSGLFVHHLVEDPIGSGLHLMEGVTS